MTSSSQLTRFLLIPLRPAALLTTGVLGAVLAVSWRAGVFGIPLILILLGWTFKYSFAFLDRLVAGDREAPVLSVEMIVGSFGEARSLLPLIIVAFAFFASGAGAFLAGPLLAALAATALLAWLPAVLAIQGWTGRLAHSLSLRTCAVMVRVLGTDYAWVVGCTLALALVCVVLPQIAGGVPSMIRIALLLYAWLALVAITGGAVHSRRFVLQQEIPLVVAELRARSPEEVQRRRELWLDSIYAAWRGGAEDTAWALVTAGIDDAHDALEDLRWLHARVAQWEPAGSGFGLAASPVPRMRGTPAPSHQGFSSRVEQELLARLHADARGVRPEATLRVPRT
ncbi:MAG TPA: hypothetical protein VN750_03120 [Steroidobacteraceae bacterium]|nr:hypothetical protein [Steroidobacteraceae bacterium]